MQKSAELCKGIFGCCEKRLVFFQLCALSFHNGGRCFGEEALVGKLCAKTRNFTREVLLFFCKAGALCGTWPISKRSVPRSTESE